MFIKMGNKSLSIFQLMLFCAVLGRTFAKIGTTADRTMNSVGGTKLNSNAGGEIKLQNIPPQIRFSRSPASQIRFGRSQPFVRFGRDGEQAASIDKYIRFARNGLDDNIRTRQQGQESKFIRFGRGGANGGGGGSSGNGAAIGPIKNDDGRSSLWWNFYRLARNPNAHIRFAGKRDGGSSNSFHAIPIEMLIEKFAHDQQKQQQQQPFQQLQQQSLHTVDGQDSDHILMNDDEITHQIDDIETADQFQARPYSNTNDLE